MRRLSLKSTSPEGRNASLVAPETKGQEQEGEGPAWAPDSGDKSRERTNISQ